METNNLEIMERLIPNNVERPTRRENWQFYIQSLANASKSTTYDMRADLEAEFARSVMPLREAEMKIMQETQQD